MTIAVRIRPLTEADVAEILGAAPRSAGWAADYPCPADREVAEHLRAGVFGYASHEVPWGPWAIIADDAVAGGCGFHGPPQDGVAEIGYNVVPSRQGIGLATRVVGLLVDRARRAGLTALVAGTDPENLPSQCVLERNGFVQVTPVDGELRWSRMLDGEDA